MRTTVRQWLMKQARIYAGIRDEYGRYVATLDDNHDEYAASVVHYSAMTVAYQDLLTKLPTAALDAEMEDI